MKSRKSNKIGKNFQPGVINSALKSKRISGIIDKSYSFWVPIYSVETVVIQIKPIHFWIAI